MGGRPPRHCSVEGCEERHDANGLCLKHRMRLRRTGTTELLPQPDRRSDPLVLFMRHVKADWETGCWLWTGNKLRGRGKFNDRDKSYQAARWAFEFIGQQTIPEGYDVDHINCPDVSCVRPGHLQTVTRSVNVKLRYARNKYTPPAHMELVPPQKAHSMTEIFTAMQYDLPSVLHSIREASQLVHVPFNK